LSEDILYGQLLIGAPRRHGWGEQVGWGRSDAKGVHVCGAPTDYGVSGAS